MSKHMHTHCILIPMSNIGKKYICFLLDTHHTTKPIRINTSEVTS